MINNRETEINFGSRNLAMTYMETMEVVSREMIPERFESGRRIVIFPKK